MELLILALFFLACVFFAAIALAVAALAIVMVKRSQPYTPPEMAQVEAAAAAHAAHSSPALLPWTRAALADLACQWRGSQGGLTVGRYEGQVTSISQPQAAGWLTFYLSLKGRQGVLRLRTSEREVQLAIERERLGVAVNGQALGSLRESDGTIPDSGEQPIGCYQRYRGLRWTMGSRSLSARYGPVELRGRRVAEVSDSLNRGGGPFSAGEAGRPLIRLCVADLTDEEENWLLALVGAELYYAALRARNR